MIYKDYELSNTHLQILKDLNKNPNSNLTNFERQDCQYLIDIGFIKTNTLKPFYKDPTTVPHYQLTEEAKMYLRHLRKDKVRTWFPIVLSIIAILISLAALYVSYLSYKK